MGVRRRSRRAFFRARRCLQRRPPRARWDGRRCPQPQRERLAQTHSRHRLRSCGSFLVASCGLEAAGNRVNRDLASDATKAYVSAPLPLQRRTARAQDPEPFVRPVRRSSPSRNIYHRKDGLKPKSVSLRSWSSAPGSATGSTFALTRPLQKSSASAGAPSFGRGRGSKNVGVSCVRGSGRSATVARQSSTPFHPTLGGSLVSRRVSHNAFQAGNNKPRYQLASLVAIARNTPCGDPGR